MDAADERIHEETARGNDDSRHDPQAARRGVGRLVARVCTVDLLVGRDSHGEASLPGEVHFREGALRHSDREVCRRESTRARAQGAGGSVLIFLRTIASVVLGANVYMIHHIAIVGAPIERRLRVQ